MGLKSAVKALAGAAAPLGAVERLLECCIARQEPSVSLAQSEATCISDGAWEDVGEPARRVFWGEVLELIGHSDLLYLEFGVHEGRSIQAISRANSSPRSVFAGFDSFEGLPEAWRGLKAGHFSTGGGAPDIEDARVSFVKGWFQDTLPPALGWIASEAQGRTPLLHLDADLYSSTLFVLFRVSGVLDDFWCMFDEFTGHEQRALLNFLQATNAACSFHKHVVWRGEPTAVLARVTMRRPATNSGTPGAPQHGS